MHDNPCDNICEVVKEVRSQVDMIVVSHEAFDDPRYCLSDGLIAAALGEDLFGDNQELLVLPFLSLELNKPWTE